MHSIDPCKKVSVSINFSVMLTGLLICIGTSFEWDDNLVKLSLQGVACKVSWKLFGQRVNSVWGGPPQAVGLGAPGAGAIQALHSLDSIDGEAWLCRASQGWFLEHVKKFQKPSGWPQRAIFSEKTPKGLFFFPMKTKVIFSRWQWLSKTSLKSYLQGLG